MIELLLGFALLVGLQLAGEALVRVLDVPFPGAVIGMLALLVLLLVFGDRLLNRIARAADLLLRNLNLFFFAPVAALALDHAKFLPMALPVLMAIFVGTPLAMIALSLVLKATLPPEASKEAGQDAGRDAGNAAPPEKRR